MSFIYGMFLFVGYFSVFVSVTMLSADFPSDFWMAVYAGSGIVGLAMVARFQSLLERRMVSRHASKGPTKPWSV